jgi:hypothetical protein
MVASMILDMVTIEYEITFVAKWDHTQHNTLGTVEDRRWKRFHS